MKIEHCVSASECSSVMKKKCIVREAVFAKVDQACYEWFMQQRSRSVPITGPILREKALQFYYKLYPNADDEKFKATTGWLIVSGVTLMVKKVHITG